MSSARYTDIFSPVIIYSCSFGATFFVFADYERPAIRLRALQGLPVISEYTHDSIYVGEDGPTHQPIEHIMACRAIPNLLVLSKIYLLISN